MLSACTAMTRTRFSRSERFADSCASCECRWFRCRVFVTEAAVVDTEERDAPGAMDGRECRELGWRVCDAMFVVMMAALRF